MSEIYNLTQRQVEILKALIEEYIETAEAVGSETLEKKHNLSASPATIRNEMVRLTELGYLKKPHTSAGRVPTPNGMKFYVKQLMKAKELSVAEEVAVKEKVWDYRDQMEKFLKETTKSLANKTKTLAVASTSEGDFFCSGYANILEMPEFYDIDITKNLLSLVDEYEFFGRIFEQIGEPQPGKLENVHVLMGEDLGPQVPASYSVVFTKFQTPHNVVGEIGVLGPVRLNYPSIVPTVKYFGDLIEEIAKRW